jgi:hypothetical protein
MRRLGYFLLVYCLLFSSTDSINAQEENTSKVEISSHQAGEAIRGIIPISGTTAVENFLSWELTFSYSTDNSGTWFLISEGDQPVNNDVLTEWDTTTIIDGVYDLRLTVFLEDDRRNHFILKDIRVRNYTPIESNTPFPTLTATPLTVTPQPSLTPSITLTPSETLIPNTLTPLPTNPIELSTPSVSGSLIKGAGYVLVAFLVMGFYTTFRRWLRKS